MRGSLLGRHFNGHIAHNAETIRLCGSKGTRKRAWASAGFDDRELIGLTELMPQRINHARENCTKQRPDFGAGDEVASATSKATRCIEALLAVEGEMHEALERDCSARRSYRGSDFVSG
jgi:hypothetical protein